MMHKAESLHTMTVRELRALRRRLASQLSDPEVVLRARVLSQGRRCGKENCRCSRGELHGPYTYLSIPRPGGRARRVYVPAGLVEEVSDKVAAADRFEEALGAITAINTELLARGEVG